MERKALLARYRAGEHVAVWSELVAMGDAVRHPPLRDEALAVARETMARVERNLSLLHDRLLELGFEFAAPDEALVFARPDAPQRLDELEAEMGPLAVSGRAFFETFHSVRFEQAETQLDDRGAPHGLAGLGSHAALVIHPFDHGAREFREYEARMIASELEPYVAGAHPPMLFVGPVLSNGQVAHFEMGAHAMDDLNFGADGREAPSFLDHLRRCVAHGGFPFWHFLRQAGIPTPSWIAEPDLERVLPKLTAGLESF